MSLTTVPSSGRMTLGSDEVLLQKMDIGFDKEYERITFPIRDIYGNLVGINGRTVTGAFPEVQDLQERGPDTIRI